MEITDLASRKQWAAFAEQLHERFNMNCTVYDATGISVTGEPRWCNRFCPRAKGNADFLATICAPGNRHFMTQAARTKSPVIGECDAGLLKVAVPVFSNGEFLGTAGGCGRLPRGGNIETFVIERTLGLGADEIADLTGGLKTMTIQQAEEMATFIEQHVAQLLDNFAAKQR